MSTYLKITDEAQSFLVEVTNGKYDTNELDYDQLIKIGEHLDLNVFDVPKELETAGIANIIRNGKALHIKENHIKEFQNQFPSNGPAV